MSAKQDKDESNAQPVPSLTEILDGTRAYLEWQRDEGVRVVELRKETLASLGAKPAPAPSATRATAAAAPSAAGAKAPAVPYGVVTIPTGAAGENPAAALQRIADAIAKCTTCPLHKSRIKTVPGQGNPTPEILFVGEGPGADEDRQGLAFIGRAGQLLTKMIEAMGYTREEVFIANVVKCHPPGDESTNRAPSPEEMATCLPYLRAQIAVLRPKVIVALGAVAVRGLLRTDVGIMRLRGQWQNLDGIPVMPTYHPAYLLRYAAAKKDVWNDLQEVLKRLGRTPPPVKKDGAEKNPPA